MKRKRAVIEGITSVSVPFYCSRRCGWLAAPSSAKHIPFFEFDLKININVLWTCNLNSDTEKSVFSWGKWKENCLRPSQVYCVNFRLLGFTFFTGRMTDVLTSRINRAHWGPVYMVPLCRDGIEGGILLKHWNKSFGIYEKSNGD